MSKEQNSRSAISHANREGDYGRDKHMINSSKICEDPKFSEDEDAHVDTVKKKVHKNEDSFEEKISKKAE